MSAGLLAIVSKKLFAQDFRLPSGDLAGVGDVVGVDCYRSQNPNLRSLAAGGSLFLVTVRPPDELWLVAILDSPTSSAAGWTAEANRCPVTNVTSLTPQIRFQNGKGINARPGALGMSLQTPRALSETDVALLRQAAAATPSAARPADRWERLRGFVKKWYLTPLRPKDGNSQSEIDAAERALRKHHSGFRLPPVLREWYGLVGRRLDGECQDPPIPLAELTIRDGVLRFLRENQDCCDAGVRVEDCEQDDPPVVVDLGDAAPGVGWQERGLPLSEFLLRHVLAETTLFGARSAPFQAVLGDLGEDVQGGWLRGVSVKTIRVHYSPLPVSDGLWSDDESDSKLFGDADTILTRLFAAARTPKALERLQSLGTLADVGVW